MILQRRMTDNQFKTHLIVGVILTVTLKLILYSVASLTIPDYLPWGYLSRILLWIWMFLLWLYVRYMEKQPFLCLKEKKHTVFFYLLSAVILTAVILGLNLFPEIFTRMKMPLADMHIQAEMMAYQHERPFLLILTAITAGIVEELIFRGYMLPRLDTLLNNQWAAIIIVSVLYAALYYTYGTWLNILIPILGSIVFGFFYLKYRSLTVVVLARICALLILGAIRF